MADQLLEKSVSTYLQEKYPNVDTTKLIPGEILRFDIDKPGNLAGWALLFPDGNGLVGDWRTGERVMCVLNKTSTSDQGDYIKKASNIISSDSNKHCRDLYKTMKEASPSHRYLRNKKVGVAKGVREYKNSIVIPGFDSQKNMITLQHIYPDGKKLFEKGTSTKGAFFIIGEVGNDMYMAEGYATAYSIYAATGKPVIVSFNAGNLTAASKSFLALHPEAKITVVADNDPPREGHIMGVGEEKARETGLEVILIPSLGMDANDYVNAGKDLKAFLEKSPKGELELTFDYDLNKDLFPPDWLIKSWIAKGNIIVLYGAAASGKSSVALDMLLSYSTAQNTWHGYEVHRHSGISVYLCGEGYSGLVSRKELWLQEHDVNPMEQFIFSKRIIPLDEIGLEKTIAELRRLNKPIDLIVIDTFRKAFNGDENSSGETERFLANCKKLSEEFDNAAIIIIAHSGKTSESRGPRGSSNLIANPDYAISVIKDDKTNTITLSQTKAKDSEEITALTLKMIKKTINRIGAGKEISSVIITDSEEGLFLPRRDGIKAGFELFKNIWRGRYEDGYPFITQDDVVTHYMNLKKIGRKSARNYLRADRIPFAPLFERDQIVQYEEGYQLKDTSLINMLLNTDNPQNKP